MLRPLGKWFKANWLPILIVAAFAATFFYGKYTGKSEQKVQCAAERSAEEKAFKEKLDDLHIEIDKQATVYETLRNARADEMLKIRKGTADEIAKNRSLSDCAATDGFVRLYDSARAGSGASSATR